MYREFDLEAVKNGAKIAVEMIGEDDKSSYRNARIICYDLKNYYSIVTAVTLDSVGGEYILQFDKDGRYVKDGKYFYLRIQEEERIPFTIEDYKDGDIVEKDGKRVTIFTVKANGNTPIVGQVGSDERIHLWTEENAKQTLVIIR